MSPSPPKGPSLPFLQAETRRAMPPKGPQFPKIDIRSKQGRRGPSGLMIWGGVLLASIYGFAMIGVTNAEDRFRKKDMREARMAVSAYLTADNNRYLLIHQGDELSKEARTMEHVPGWKTGKSVYSTPRLPPKRTD